MDGDTDWRTYISEYGRADEYVPVENSDWYDDHEALYRALPDLLNRVPSDFESDVHIEGLDATDVFGLNEVLASTVENQVVESLNNLKPDMLDADQYQDYEFVRQSQTFPDVLLQNSTDPTEDPLMGIELKCWYLIAKEGDPSFRFKTTVEACAPQDVLVVYPWALDNIVTGSPEIFRPFVMPAKFASLFIDYYWQNLKNWRDDDPDKSITHPTGVGHYPSAKTDFIQDKPAQDDGNNYGRFRSKPISKLPPLQEWVNRMKARELLGVPSESWRAFFTSTQNDDTGINELEDLTGIGDATADALRAKGYTTPASVKTLLINVLSDMDGVSGIGSKTAEDIIDDLANVRVND
jgi:hypothetical protein